MTLKGTRFGSIEFAKSDVIQFPDGMIGFQNLRKYVVVHTKEGSPYRWLQSVEEPKLAFLVSVPESFVGEYAPEISNSEAESLGLKPETPQPTLATANLAAPVIINLETRQAKQVILEDEAYTIRYPIFSGQQDVANLAVA
jgi:flagellar assembly factor FliW